MPALHVDCSSDGLTRRPPVPVFQDDRITLQSLGICAPTYHAAITGHVEARSFSHPSGQQPQSEAEKNALCQVAPVLKIGACLKNRRQSYRDRSLSAV